MSTTPATIGRVDGYDNPLAIGSPAHLTLYDPTHRGPVTMPVTKSDNNPFCDLELPGRVITTIYGGAITVRDSEIQDSDTLRAGKASNQ